MPVPRTTRARATAAPRIACPVALTPRQGKRHPWQATRVSFHLGHDDRVKKGVPRYLNPYPFPFPLSLLPQGPGKGIFRKGSFSAKETGPPSPPTDQGFEGWPLGRVRQLPQSTWAPSPLLIRGSKAGPSEGFDNRPRALGLRAHY
jgi:hypothetical protein